MAHGEPSRFPIRFEPWYAALSTALLLPPSRAYVEVDGDEILVRMGWAFRARFPRSAIAATTPSDEHPWSRGVHGLLGRWLVNGAGSGLLTITLRPPQRAHVLGLPVRLRELMVSVSDPAAVGAALKN